jgi:hypothetical protein
MVGILIVADPTIADIRTKNYIAAKTLQYQLPLSVGHVLIGVMEVARKKGF